MGFVQAVQNVGIGNTSATLPSSVTGGNTIVVFADSILAQGTITSVTDNKGNTYTMVGSFTVLAGAQQHIVQVWVATGATGRSSFAVTSHSGGAFILLTVFEYGSTAIFVFDKSATAANASSTSQSVGPIGTTLSADELLLCYIATVTGGAQTFTAGAGYTKRNSTTNDPIFGNNFAIEDQIVSSTGAYSASWTLSSATGCALV